MTQPILFIQEDFKKNCINISSKNYVEKKKIMLKKKYLNENYNKIKKTKMEIENKSFDSNSNYVRSQFVTEDYKKKVRTEPVPKRKKQCSCDHGLQLTIATSITWMGKVIEFCGVCNKYFRFLTDEESYALKLEQMPLPTCKCKFYCVIKKASEDAQNPGRLFFTCAKNNPVIDDRSKKTSCDFFEWVDVLESAFHSKKERCEKIMDKKNSKLKKDDDFFEVDFDDDEVKKVLPKPQKKRKEKESHDQDVPAKKQKKDDIIEVSRK